MGKRIICLGDSITEGVGDQETIGWPGRLSQHIRSFPPADEWRVINAGVAGDTSIDIYHRLLSEIRYREPSCLIIAAGVNDTAHRLWPDAQGQKVDISYAKEIWMKILNTVKNLSGVKAVFLSPLPVDEKKSPLVYMPYDEDDKGNDMSNKRIARYIEMQKKLVTASGFPYVDLYSEWQSLPFEELLNDGLHPNKRGYDLLSVQIIKALDNLDFWND